MIMISDNMKMTETSNLTYSLIGSLWLQPWLQNQANLNEPNVKRLLTALTMLIYVGYLVVSSEIYHH